MNVAFIVASVLVQYPLMLAFPILLGWWIKRRYGIGWGIFGVGALTFIASQVVHLPLNMALGLFSDDRGVALWPLPLMAVAAGLSAAVCETTIRWVALRYFLKQARGWRPALQFGAGHGAIESIVFGLIALGTLVNMIILQSQGLEGAGLTGDQLVQATAAAEAYWSNPWYVPILAGLERVFTIVFHVAMAVLVMKSITSRRCVYFVAAIVLHTILDTWAVWASQTWNLAVVEAGIFVISAFSLWLIVRLREEAPAAIEEDHVSLKTVD